MSSLVPKNGYNNKYLIFRFLLLQTFVYFKNNTTNIFYNFEIDWTKINSNFKLLLLVT